VTVSWLGSSIPMTGVRRRLTSPMPLPAQLLQTQRDNLAELLEALSPDDEATLSLAMRVAVPLLDELTNVAINKPPANVSAPRH
jgi:hypothetical protein